MTTPEDSERDRVFEKAIAVMAEFRKTFGRPLSPDFVAELYVARLLNLEVHKLPNQPGYDAVDKDGLRYEVKERNAQNVDLNSFDFDFLVLVNLDLDYHLTGIWRLSKEVAESIFMWREKFHKYQATQDKIKAHAQKIY